jgi:hypothetical protein
LKTSVRLEVGVTEMFKTINFNTGRQYTAFGQRITATLHDDGVVTFMDHDRKIDGEYHEVSPADFSQRTVMDEYDTNGYTSTARSWAAGMVRDGCNSKYEGK